MLGQDSFTDNAANDDDQDGTQDTNPTARTFNSPTGVYFFDGRLLVADNNNNRYLLFQ